MDGMWVPGLHACGLTMQPSRFARVFRSVPAAIHGRLLRCVNDGPTVACAAVPPIVWHVEQPAVRNTRWPESATESTGGVFGWDDRAIHARNWSGGSAMMSSAILACCNPQNSAHWPR